MKKTQIWAIEGMNHKNYPPEVWHSPWKITFHSNHYFSGALLNFGKVFVMFLCFLHTVGWRAQLTKLHCAVFRKVKWGATSQTFFRLIEASGKPIGDHKLSYTQFGQEFLDENIILSSQTHITIDDRCCHRTDEVPPFAPCQSLAEPPGSPQYMNALYGHMPPPLGMGWSSKVYIWWNWDPSRFRQRCNEMRANREKIENIIILVDMAYYNRITQIPYIIHLIHALWQKGVSKY